MFSSRTASRTVAGFVLLGLAGVVPVAVQAQTTLTPGNNPGVDEQNVLLNNNQTGATVTGTTNQTGTLVQFTSTTDTLFTPSNGQARIEAEDGILNSLTISVPDGTFVDLIANAFIGGQPQIGDGTLTFTLDTSAGAQTIDNFSLSNGQNFFTLVANSGVTINSVTLSSETGINDLRQIRLSGVVGGNPGGGGQQEIIPEPGTFALLGAGLLPLAGAAIRRRRNA
jgi:hypothetical protein